MENTNKNILTTVIDYIKKNLFLVIACLVTLLVIIAVSIQYVSFRQYEVEFAVRDNVKVEKLSKYFDKLEGSFGDTEIYIIGTENPDEPSILLLGGVHPNEPAGQIASTILMEQIDVTRGTVYIITEANKSAYSHSLPQEATPFYYDIDTPWGSRTFKFGARATNAIDQWPIPDVYVHSATGQKLSGTDTRNLNRSFPGNETGNFTELIATGIINLINQRDITLVLDLHEASPEYGTNNALIYHEKGESIAGMMPFLFALTEPRFKPIKMELSPNNLRGLSHREIGDNTNAIPFLAETSNTTQGRIREAVTPENIVSGEDKFYQRATALGILEVDHSESVSLHERTGRHVQTFIYLTEAYNMVSNDSKGSFVIDYKGMNFTNILDNGVGYYLRDPKNPNN